jgi:hypothetical protein
MNDTRCAFRAMPGRAFAQCKRTGRYIIHIRGGDNMTRPLCWQHIKPAMATAETHYGIRAIVEAVA